MPSSSSSSSRMLNDPRLSPVARHAIAAQPAVLHDFLVATTLHFLHRTGRIHAIARRNHAPSRVWEERPDPSSSSSSSWPVPLAPRSSSATILQNEPAVVEERGRPEWPKNMRRPQLDDHNDAAFSVSLTRKMMVEDRLHWFVDKMQAITYGLFVAYYHHPTTKAAATSSRRRRRRRRHHCSEHGGATTKSVSSSSTALLFSSSLDWKGLAAATLYEYYRDLHPTAGLVADLETTKEHLIALHQLRRRKAAAKVVDVGSDGGTENEKKMMKNQKEIIIEPPPPAAAWIGGGGDAPVGDLAAPMPDLPPSSSASPLASPAAVAKAVKSSSSSNNNNSNNDNDNETLFRTLDQDSKRAVADMVQTVGTALAVLTRALFVETKTSYHHRATTAAVAPVAVVSTGSSTRPRRARLAELTLDGPLPTPRLLPPPPPSSSSQRYADTTTSHQQPQNKPVPPPHDDRRRRPPLAVAADVVVSSSSNHHHNFNNNDDDDDTVENHENHPTRNKRGRSSNHHNNKNNKKRKMTFTTSTTTSSDRHHTSLVLPQWTKKQRVL